MPVGPVQRDARSTEFFDGTAEGRLLLRQCSTCEHVTEPASGICPACGNDDLSWVESAGRGVVAACGVVHSRLLEGSRSMVPVAYVELDEGPWIPAQLVGVDPAAVRVGLRVRVAFERADGGEAVAVFGPARA
jgi:uncharacterized OB-fold protein